jgi:DnaJ homolog subfamily C member 8
MASTKDSQGSKDPPSKPAEEEKDDLAALDAIEREASEFTKVSLPAPSSTIELTTRQDAEIDRITKTFKLDAYAVLDLQPGVPESEIKMQYRKKSLLIHPDKTKNPAAPSAFDALKKAQIVLMDEKQRAYLDEAIVDGRTLLMRERKLTPDSPEMREPMPAEIKRAWREMTVKVLVEQEARRRKQLKAQMQEEGREQKKQDEEVEARKRKREHEQAWESTRDARIGSWREFSKTKASGGGGEKKKKKMKVLG